VCIIVSIGKALGKDIEIPPYIIRVSAIHSTARSYLSTLLSDDNAPIIREDTILPLEYKEY